MRKFLKKVVVVTMAVALAVTSAPISNNLGLTVETSALTYKNENVIFGYNVTATGVEITDYRGTATVVDIPEEIDGVKVTSIGEWAFCNCSSLTSIEIPSSVTSIGISAFSYCTSLTSIKIPGSVTSIGNSAFWDCSSLNRLEIPSGVKVIGNNAFCGCRSLTGIEISSSVTSIGNSVFSGCSSLTSIVVASDNSVYDSRDNCNAIIKTKDNTLVVGCKNTQIPGSVTSIGNYAFEDCTGLTSIEIPSGVTSIRSYAFGGCSNLTNIVVASDNSVYDSRDNCNAIIKTEDNTLVVGCKNTQIPSSVENIGSSAFYGCTGLTGIKIPSSVTSIGSYAFYNCNNLTIKCISGSYADTYARQNNIPVEYIELLNGFAYNETTGIWGYYKDDVIDTTYTG
ncbi:MAG: leucine-rich repeat protein, partial [Lachnospiraceae bacterium]